METIKTQGFRYAGSKNKIIPSIIQIIKETGAKSVFDGFSGTTRVTQALKFKKYLVYSNDLNIWSNVFAKCFLLNEKPKEYYEDIINHLNNIKPRAGWFTENYGGIVNTGKSSIQSDGKKKPWQIHNTMKLDSIRYEIELISSDDIEKSVLLTSLILAMDSVDNTLGHHVSYLKDWSPRSYKNMIMKVPNFILDDKKHKVFSDDMFNLLDKTKEVDLCYYDPPYGSNNDVTPTTRVRYNSYYHLWKTIILNENPELFGSANRRADSKDKFGVSIFEEYKKENGRFIAETALKNLIVGTKCENILLSYSNNGRVSVDNIISLIRDNNKHLKVFTINYKDNAMKVMTKNGNWENDKRVKNVEYLFLISNKSIKDKTSIFFN